MATLLTIIMAYLMGSLSSSIILCKITKTPDPREQGSGNPGATNMLRISGKKMAVLTLLGDVLKGLIAVYIGRFFNLPPFALSLVALAAFLGHLYPIFFQFKGGKGVATFFGVLFALSPILTIVTFAIWLITAILSRYSSLAALIASAVAPFYIVFVGEKAYLCSVIIMTTFLFWRHKNNIMRLLKGTETKIQM